ncbi:MAG: SDR family oxidoreductase, partial [Pyrinomonadaceae bacterium]|nr:SDR family oxidoreductase [Pyrinomonadaceae bacterium]
AAHGIGKALAHRFAIEKAKAIVVADVDFENAQIVANKINGTAVRLDVGNEAEIIKVVEQTTDSFGQIDLVCSNAGIAGDSGGIEVSNESWQNIWEINMMSHVYLTRAVLPQMIERKSGYFLITASAAGLLTHVEGASYSVTKHAAVAYAEWLSIAYHDAGIRVSCLCPQGVKTRMVLDHKGKGKNFLLDGAIEPELVADITLKGIENEQFLILPHAEVADFFKNKAENYERWLHALRKMRREILSV